MKAKQMEHPNKVYVNRKFNCSATQLFDWLIKPELIAQWFGPKDWSVENIQTDVKVGGQFSIELRRSDSRKFFLKGKYIEIKPPTNLVFSFHYIGLSPAPPDSMITIRFKQLAPNESQLFLTQEFESMPQDMATRIAAWQHMLETLGQLVQI
ncbi:MAG: SRPBCC domain-containing protein [Reichenbachiella sp.]|uniref:SRPBCC family protein n=1 Tax=Reichenbachiella sp. TaxID=2184521 RepID=UPI0032649F92